MFYNHGKDFDNHVFLNEEDAKKEFQNMVAKAKEANAQMKEEVKLFKVLKESLTTFGKYPDTYKKVTWCNGRFSAYELFLRPASLNEVYTIM